MADNIESIQNFKREERYLVEYLLMDDGGFNPRTFEILLPVGTEFEHEYGTYIVTKIDKNDGGRLMVLCDRIYSSHDEFDKHLQ